MSGKVGSFHSGFQTSISVHIKKYYNYYNGFNTPLGVLDKHNKNTNCPVNARYLMLGIHNFSVNDLS